MPSARETRTLHNVCNWCNMFAQMMGFTTCEHQHHGQIPDCEADQGDLCRDSRRPRLPKRCHLVQQTQECLPQPGSARAIVGVLTERPNITQLLLSYLL